MNENDIIKSYRKYVDIYSSKSQNSMYQNMVSHTCH